MPSGYAFGPFVVDVVKRRLWRDGRLVSINSKTFDVLVVLVQQRDHIVSKEELRDRVWPNVSQGRDLTRFDPSTGTPAGDPFAVTTFRSAQFQLTPADGPDGHRRHRDALAVADVRIAKRYLDAGSERSSKMKRKDWRGE
jgi:hypothetical protein